MRNMVIASVIGCLSAAVHAELDWTPSKLITVAGYDGAPFAATGLVDRGWFDSLITADGPGKLTVTFLGKEATHSSTLSFNNGAQSLSNTAAVGSTLTVPIGGAGDTPLGFLFRDTVTGNTVSNGVVGGTYASYAVLGVGVSTQHPSTCGFTDMCELSSAKVGGVTKAFDLVLGFSDSYQGDHDYDDMVVGLNFATVPVPEPETSALMLAGLGALAFVARRRPKRVS